MDLLAPLEGAELPSVQAYPRAAAPSYESRFGAPGGSGGYGGGGGGYGGGSPMGVAGSEEGTPKAGAAPGHERRRHKEGKERKEFKVH